MFGKLSIILLGLLLVAITACNTVAEDELDGHFNQCTEPRPQICTREWNPVCATKTNGSKATYATGCTACADPEVKGYVPGECGS